MFDHKQNVAATDRPMTRIEIDVERVKGLASRVQSIVDRTVRNARMLGYYEPQPASAGSVAPTPVVTSLDDALRDLERAIDNGVAALDLFG